ncbi:PREDICTED: uncharacterized protein LOC109236524 [Nicotiana attenuata]|uniref:uncharacterized protein LOC109236524 n=1 Tax=Nicotiana attenuata TaxID=49451 RepID=UPI000904C16F|nr:PREDICTED: uncharacterized protein LOC109236524 [Nicotiana attenuata]
MEYLSRNLASLKEEKDFKFHPRCAKLGITHLSFADDLLLFTRGDLKSVQTMQKKFTQFTEASGLQENLSKSEAYFGGVQETERQQILQCLGFTSGELPFKYLGIPLATKKLSLMQWQPLIEKMTRKITSWTAKNISYAGRLQLVQSVLFGVQAFWAQIFILPAKVTKLVEGLCRSYVWSGANEITKRALVAWDKVCLSKAGGGLNLINLKLWNIAAIAKTSWDLAHKQDKLWIKWLHAYYIKTQQLKTMAIPQQACWMVRKVIESYSIIEEMQFSQDWKKSMIKQIYLHLLGDYSRMEWKALVFQNAARPKAQFIMWLLIQDRLMTCDRLINWKINVEPECVMCKQENETRDHLFWQCPYATQVWNKMCRWLGKQHLGNGNWQQFLQWTIRQAKGKSSYAMTFRMIFAETVYHLWLERNRRVFEKKSRKEEQLTRDSICS